MSFLVAAMVILAPMPARQAAPESGRDVGSSHFASAWPDHRDPDLRIRWHDPALAVAPANGPADLAFILALTGTSLEPDPEFPSTRDRQTPEPGSLDLESHVAITGADFRAWAGELELRAYSARWANALCGPFIEPPNYVLSQLIPDRLIVGDVAVMGKGRRQDTLSALFFEEFLAREGRFLANLSTTDIVTVGVESGAQDLDFHHFWHLERRVVVDSLRKSAKEYYGIPKLDLDFVVDNASRAGVAGYFLVPLATAAYAFGYGFERTIRFGDFAFFFNFEKGQHTLKALRERENYRALETLVKIQGLPFGPMASFETDHGALRLEFIGIGTTLQAATEALKGEEK